jgi:hypothetical protein
MSVSALEDYSALHRLLISLLFVFLNMHVVWDFPCFVSYMLYNYISVFRWGHVRYVLNLRSHNADNGS